MNLLSVLIFISEASAAALFKYACDSFNKNPKVHFRPRKPDIYFGFPMQHDRDIHGWPQLHKHCNRYQHQIFSYSQLFRLQEAGLCSTPNKPIYERPGVPAPGKHKRKRHQPESCFPWMIAEIKAENAQPSTITKNTKQLADGSSTALEMMIRLAQYDRPDKQHTSGKNLRSPGMFINK
jgi:hypothetical protein